ncbi:MAG: 4Fe-4S dicluster domain-containing protein [Desulfomonilaceae bacterium]
MFRFTGDALGKNFLRQVIDKSGQNLLECLQCGKCSGSCPVASENVPGPRQLVAEILSGLKDEALNNPLWWYCVSCGTCMTRCPVEINMYEVATALSEIAQKEGVQSSEPDIHLFEEIFLKSVEKYGRVKELRTVAIYNFRTRHFLKDMDKGITLMRKGAISPFELLKGWKKDPSVSRIFEKVRKGGQGE